MREWRAAEGWRSTRFRNSLKTFSDITELRQVWSGFFDLFVDSYAPDPTGLLQQLPKHRVQIGVKFNPDARCIRNLNLAVAHRWLIGKASKGQEHTGI